MKLIIDLIINLITPNLLRSHDIITLTHNCLISYNTNSGCSSLNKQYYLNKICIIKQIINISEFNLLVSCTHEV